jgi:hypothetical protein
MADLGFTDFYEALEVYSELDPASVRIGDQPASRVRPVVDAGESHLRLPGALVERLTGSSPFARALGAIGGADELAEIHHALVALCNRALSADRVSPGDHETLSAVLGRVAATLDLAVEFLARGSEERAVAAVRAVPLVRLFQLGVSLVGKVRKLALSLGKQTPFAGLGVHGHLFEAEDAEVIAAVTRLRPLFPRRLESPPAPGERPFSSLADVALATTALERAGAAVALLHGLGVRAEQLAPPALDDAGVELAALDHGILGRTVVAARLVGGEPGPFRPFPATKLEALHDRLAAVTAGDLRKAVHAVLATAAPGGTLTPAMVAVADRWTASLVPLDSLLTTAGLSAPRP